MGFSSSIVNYNPPKRLTDLLTDWLTNKQTKSMEQSPSEASSHSASQILRLLWNSKIHYRVHKSPPLIPALNHMNPTHTLPPYFPKIHSNIILSSTPRSSAWSVPSIAYIFPKNPSSSEVLCKKFVTSWFIGCRVVRFRPSARGEDHPLSSVRDCLLNVFAASLHVWREYPPSATQGHATSWPHITLR
jgi:hypothetical protein